MPSRRKLSFGLKKDISLNQKFQIQSSHEKTAHIVNLTSWKNLMEKKRSPKEKPADFEWQAEEEGAEPKPQELTVKAMQENFARERKR